MRDSLISIILEFLKRHLVQKRWRRTVTCLAAVVVFCTTYLLMLPAISMTKNCISLSAENLSAWSGDRLSVQVSARTEENEDGKIFVLLAEGVGADLSEDHVFNEEGICIITDENGREIELHRVVREKKQGAPEENGVTDYWFSLGAGEQTDFTLLLSDEVDEKRFYQAAEAVKSIAGVSETAEASKTDGVPEAAASATVSDAEREEENKAENAEVNTAEEKATDSDADRIASVSDALVSDSDYDTPAYDALVYDEPVCEAPAPVSYVAASVSDAAELVPGEAAPAPAAEIKDEEEDDKESGFIQLPDGEIVNDLPEDQTDENEEQTEIVASLKLSAGSGRNYTEAVRDAEKNADKRESAQLKFTWKDIVEHVFITPEMVWVGDGVQAAVIFDGDAKLPEDAVLSVTEIEQGTQEYDVYLAQAVSAVKASGSDASKEMGVDYARFFDICILDGDGNEVEPAAPVKVLITYNEAVSVGNGGDLSVMHFHEENDPEVLEAEKAEAGKAEVVRDVSALSFTADRFSVFGVVRSSIEKLILASDGQAYRISVTCGPEAGVPAAAELAVSEITEESAAYVEYVSKAENALGLEKDSASYVRLFDIKILDEAGNKVEISAPVNVEIALADKEKREDGTDSTGVVHFADGAEQPDVVQGVDIAGAASKGEGVKLTFAAEGFSVYAIVDFSETAVDLLDIIGSTGAQGFQMTVKTGQNQPSGTDTYYVKEGLIHGVSGNSDRDGLDAQKYTGESIPSDAGTFYFERIGETNEFYIYKKDGETRNYIQMTPVSGQPQRAGLTYTEDEDRRTAFTLQVGTGARLHISAKIESSDGKLKTFYWVRNSKGSGTDAIVGYENKTDLNTAWVGLYREGDFEDLYNLNDKTYSFLTWDGGKTAKAMMAAKNNDTVTDNLAAKLLTVMTSSDDETDKLYVPAETSDTATAWTFHSVTYDLYRLSSDDGKYLKISSSGLKMVDSQADASTIQVIPGTGIHAGQIILKDANTGAILTYSGEYAKGFNVNAGTGKEYLYLAESKPESALNDGYFKTYSASKVSVSNLEKVCDQQRIIIYTRAWNGSKYDYFALDGEGNLVPCIESGDKIEWVGPTLNEMQWIFNEYGEYDDEGNFVPNYYYDLQNEYTGLWLAPLLEIEGKQDAQILSYKKVGLNLPGRRNGQYYTPFLAWDEKSYTYASISVDLDAPSPAIEPCYRVDGMDFYFAIIDEVDPDDSLHTVPTVDNNQYGITMRIVDLTNGATSDAAGYMNEYLNNTTTNGLTTVHTPGLLSTDLDRYGYPTAHKGSLKELFSGAQKVNHMFIDSTYRATGYYEFDSAQNFASLKGTDFVVYQELGSYDSGGNKYTLKHGQFFPYNDLTPGHFATTNGRNLYTPTGQELSADDPRRNEQLYLIDNVNTFFAMELEAGFTQTPSGLDAWGHDIIFEFSGDDDFWLYVDGELIIDLGGIHSAVPGSVNFRTGDVHVNGTDTTLRELFENNYRARNPGASDTDVSTYLGKYFEEGKTVFKDGTDHTMRIFYMERGAGASNLHMRFNLASLKKGTVQLSKDLDGVDNVESTFATFPYQIWYKNPISSTGEYIQLTPGSGTNVAVTYLDSVNDVEYLPELKVLHEITGGEAYEVTYDHVYFLKPGETALISFPVFGQTGDEKYVEEYKIVECGVDPVLYPSVTVNGISVEGSPAYANAKIHADGTREEYSDSDEPVDSGLRNYEIAYSTVNNGSKIGYVNTVGTTGTLTIQKELYKKETEEGAGPEKIDLYQDDGTLNVLPDNPDLERVFEFRLSFKTPYDRDYSPATYYSYHVKDPAGHYCKKDPQTGRFVPITNGTYPDGITDFDDLTPNQYDESGHMVVKGEQFWATFETSMNGSISEIPAYYTVEVRELIPGTHFRLVERPQDMPDGYQFWQYALDGQAYESITDPMDGITGSISAEQFSRVLVKNYKGYGLRLKKIWADASTIEDRQPTWFAVFCETKAEDGTTTRVMVGDSVQMLKYSSDPDSQELYWYYLDLPLPNTLLKDYVVYEVKRIAAENGTDEPEYTYEPVLNNGILLLSGTPLGEEEIEIDYKVTYEAPEEIGDNVLKFEATDTPSSRPAVRFRKEDWSDHPLAGATFTLAQGSTQIFGEDGKSSDTDGLISTEYLGENISYVLTETAAPQGYCGLPDTLRFQLVADTEHGWTLDILESSEDIDEYYKVGHEVETDPGSEESTEYVTLTIKNCPYVFQAIKTDAADDSPVKGIVFNLYTWKTVGGHADWYGPMAWEGSSALITNKDGLIPHLDSSLPAGTYQLREFTADGFSTVDDIDFTVSQLGVITLGTHPESVTLKGPDKGIGDQAGKLVYTLTIPNVPLPLKLKKVDMSGKALTGAKFSLSVKNGKSDDGHPIWAMVEGYNEIDLTDKSEIDLSLLPTGTYRLEETVAPEDCIILVKYHYFEIDRDRTVTLCDENGAFKKTDDVTFGNFEERKSSLYIIDSGGQYAKLDEDAVFDPDAVYYVKTECSSWGNAALSGSLAEGYIITVTNTSGVGLPATGGPGTRVFTILGGLLAAGAGILLLFRVRRRMN
ncbi:MAG: hypothetical protein IJT43_03325 [Stomatobaculum sp.]|nr:hypothetical protein [Stomatobaculum sp.]